MNDMAAHPPARVTGHHVLLVDDDEDLRTVLRKILVRAGHEVTEARDGSEAFTQLRLRPPGLLITDLIMPGKEGVEVIAEVRRISPATKIIAISGSGRRLGFDHLGTASGAGAHRVLEKPFSSAELLGAIEDVMSVG